MLRCFSKVQVVAQPLRSMKTSGRALELQTALLTEPPEWET